MHNQSIGTKADEKMIFEASNEKIEIIKWHSSINSKQYIITKMMDHLKPNT